MAQQVTILGGTGTIGDNMLALLRMHRDRAQLFGISAYQNLDKLAQIISEFLPQIVAVPDLPHDHALHQLCRDKGAELLIGDEAIAALAARPVDLVVGAIVGMAGLSSVMSAVVAGQTIALANKESLVAAGHIVMPALSEYGAKIIPVDSEHNAIHQCLMGQEANKVEQITLTASGGPFLHHSAQQMRHVTKADALAHPNWVMGAKVSIDSATLMNKGLELLEASHLFGVGGDVLSAIIHPQSVVHGLVEYRDSSVIAHLAEADMKLPLGFALGLEERLPTGTKRLNLTTAGRLDFFDIDREKFPCFALAEQVIDAPAQQAIILNAANEIAVEAFLDDRLAFHEIAVIVDKTLHQNFTITARTLDDVYALDTEARAQAMQFCNGR